MKFEAYPKTPRFKNMGMTITEKIDGTNAQIIIDYDKITVVGSRKRVITPEDDNYGFAKWAYENEEGLVDLLGEGRHYGEWAGLGIQKNPLDLPQKFFFVFNVHRHTAESFEKYGDRAPDVRPVPTLYKGDFSSEIINTAHDALILNGTRVPEAGPNAKAPEGIIISAFGQKFKLTENNTPKGSR